MWRTLPKLSSAIIIQISASPRVLARVCIGAPRVFSTENTCSLERALTVIAAVQVGSRFRIASVLLG